jgi:ribonuclease PH
VDLSKLGERTIVLDCDVIQADGGTRTAAITGAYVALALALRHLEGSEDGVQGVSASDVLRTQVAATSVGLVAGELLLDLCYEEDSSASADFNIAMTDNGLLVEVQGSAEAEPFTRQSLEAVLSLAEKGIRQLFDLQRQVLEGTLGT